MTTSTYGQTSHRDTVDEVIADTGGYVTLCSPDGRPWGRGRFELRGVAGRNTGELVAPLWMVSLGGTVRIRFTDGRETRLRVREITAMDGPVATVRADVVA